MKPPLLLLLPALLAAQAGAAPPPAHVAEFLRKHCNECHGAKEVKGDLRLDDFPADFLDREKAAIWVEVMDRINGGEMPPKKVTVRPSAAEITPVVDWIAAGVSAGEAQRRGTGGQVVLRRLNRGEYRNTVRDLFGFRVLPAFSLPEDNVQFGFNNIGQALSVSPTHVEEYLAAARILLDQAVAAGPAPETLRTRVGAGGTQKGGRPPKNGAWTSGSYNFQGVSRDGVLRLENGHVQFKELPVPAAGEYVVRLAASRADAERPAPRIELALSKTKEVIFSGEISAPPGKMQTVEVRLFLTPGQDGGKKSGATTGFTLGCVDPPRPPGRKSDAAAPAPDVLVDWLEFEGPLTDVAGGATHAKWFFRGPSATGGAGYAREILERFMAAAYRRPLTPGDLATVMPLVEAELRAGEKFEEAVKLGMQFVLCAPDFLYLVEGPGAAPGKAYRLTDWEIASRLSYFLWSTMPDAELFRAAQAGSLRDPAVRAAQVKRMLADPRAAMLAEHFAAQWLELGKVPTFDPNKGLFPAYDAHLEESMIAETKLFFLEVLRAGLPVRNFLHSDFSMLNERLARHYDIAGVTGDAFRRVALPADSHRGGLLAQASVLKLTSDCERTKPVIRGKWVLENILGTPPPPPPPNVNEVEPVIPGAAKLTLRERLAKHREDVNCAACHARIDPIGFALENFDATGAWRTSEKLPGKGKDPAVDASGRLTDGREFSGIDEFRKILLADEAKFHRCLSEKLLIYALGRGMEFSDRAAVAQLAAGLQRDPSLGGLITRIVQSEAFITK